MLAPRPRQAVANLETEVSGLKTDVGELKMGVSTILERLDQLAGR
jgi:hypothetical protein